MSCPPEILGKTYSYVQETKWQDQVSAVELSEARVLVNSWSSTTVVLMSREVPQPGHIEEAVLVPPLSNEVAAGIVKRFSAGSRILTWSSLPESVRDAIRRPLFALLLGHYLSASHSTAPRSTADLIANLVSGALRQVQTDRVAVESLLRTLARQLTDRGGGFIPISEAIPQREATNLQPLLDAGLITKRDELIAFPLAILTEWFAAQSLAHGDPKIDDLVSDGQRLARWYFPLLIAVGTQSHEVTTRLLSSITRKDPALAFHLVENGLAAWGISEDVMPPPATECGKRLIDVASVWLPSLGVLSELFGPIRPDGTLRSLGVATSGATVSAGWYFGNEKLDPIVLLSSPMGILLGDQMASADWTGLRWSSRSVRPGGNPSWAWRWVRDDISSWLAKALRHRGFPPPSQSMRIEAAWLAGAALADTSPPGDGAHRACRPRTGPRERAQACQIDIIIQG
jgi:hypothetical protein